MTGSCKKSSGLGVQFGGSRQLARAALLAAAAPGLLALWSTQAQAADGDSAGNEASGEIVVTAQRRAQGLIDVPAAVTAVTGAELRARNLTNITSVTSLVPNFSVNYNRGANTVPTLTIRGISGDGLSSRVNESSIAVYVDEVYLGDESMLTGAIFDVDRVEVLRGPQGTLFGRNTTGGLTHFVSAKPTSTFSGHASAMYGSDNATVLEAAVSGPVSDRVRVRVAAQWDRNDGHYENTLLNRPANVPFHLGAKDVWAVRGIVDVDLTDTAMLTVIAQHAESHSQSTPGRSPGTLDPADPTAKTFCSLEKILAGACVSRFTIGSATGFPPHKYRAAGLGTTNLTADQLAVGLKSNMFTGKLKVDLGWAELNSVTNYSDNNYFQNNDSDAGSDENGILFNLVSSAQNREHQFSEELRLSGSHEAFDWVGGVYYYADHKESRVTSQTLASPGLTAPSAIAASESAVDTKAAAFFAQLDVHLSKAWTLTIGQRYSEETRELKKAVAIVGAASNDVLAFMKANSYETKPKTRDITGRISIAFKPSDELNAYLSYSRGAKSVGFNTVYSSRTSDFGVNDANATGPVGQEKLDAFELGMKNRLLENRLSINSAIFYYIFDGKQQVLNQFINGSPSARFINVGKVRLYGAETELNFRPNDDWDLSFSGGLLENKIYQSNVIVADPIAGQMSLQGKRLQQTPKWNYNFTIARHLTIDGIGRFTLQGEGSGVGHQYYSITNNPLSADKSRFVANVRLAWTSPDKRIRAEAFVTNLFNRDYYLYAQDAVLSQLGFIASTEAEGRLWGVKLGMNF